MAWWKCFAAVKLWDCRILTFEWKVVGSYTKSLLLRLSEVPLRTS